MCMVLVVLGTTGGGDSQVLLCVIRMERGVLVDGELLGGIKLVKIP